MGNRAYTSGVGQAYPTSAAVGGGGAAAALATSDHLGILNDASINVVALGVTSVSFWELTGPIIADGSTNLSTTDAVPIMLSNTSPSGISFASANYAGLYPWEAFGIAGSGNNYDFASSNAPSVGSPHWLGYEFPTGTAINKVMLTSRQTAINTQSAADFTIEGSLDGVSYVILKTIVNETGWVASTAKTYTFTNSVAYTHYRIKCTRTNGGAHFGVEDLALIANAQVQSFDWLIQAPSPTTTYSKVTPQSAGSKTIVITNKSGVTKDFRVEYAE